MTDNPNAPDPRIGEISKALDEFEEAVIEITVTSIAGRSPGEIENLKWDRKEKREEMMNLIRRLIDHV